MSFCFRLCFLVQKNILYLLLVLFCISCNNLSFQKNEYELFQKIWVKETIKEPFKYSNRLQTISPVLGNGFLVQGNKSTGLYAYISKNGKQKWFFPIKGGLSGGVLLTANRVFFSGADGFFYSLDLQAGQVIWKFYTGTVNSSAPILHKGVIYFASPERLYALSAYNGKSLWTYGVSLKSKAFVVEGVATPLMANKKIYFKPNNNSVIALNLKGKLKWKKQLSSNTRFASSGSALVMGSRCLYTAHFESGLFCLNKRNGRIIWKNSIPSHGNILLSGSFLFYPTKDGKILALHQKSGKVIWTYKTPKSTPTSLALYKNTLIYGEYRGALRFLSKQTGKEQGYFAFGSGMSAPPVVSSVHSELYFLSNFGWLYKLKLLL